MIVEIDMLRRQFGRFLLPLFWGHVPLLAAVAAMTGHSPAGAAAGGALLAGAYHLTWWREGTSPATRYLSAIALMGEPAMLLFLLRGHAWQMDMHMYFFAMLALTIAWCDKRAILVAATATALHHLLLLYLLPIAVFPGQGNVERVLLHAGIVAFQTTVLMWLSDKLVESFARNQQMGEEILAKNVALEERTREAEEASRAKSLFLANMSHEIRTPMNAILGFCHLAQRGTTDPRQKDYLGKIAQAGSSLLRLINDILDYSKNEAGKLTLERHPFSLRRAIENQINLVAETATAKQVTIESHIADDVPERLVGDEVRFGQVALNLLSNAVKFSERGKVTVRLAMAEAGNGAPLVELSVRDTGIGMSAQQQQSLFSSFTQADSSTTRRFGGTGLGLAICRQIVEQMDGDIRVESAPGAGSCFTCRMRMAPEADGDVREATAPDHVRSLRVLAADDNPASRQIMQDMFAGWDMAVDLVASGDEAVAAVEAADRSGRPYDLLLLDWKMPGMDGMTAIRAVRAMALRHSAPRMVIVTAYGAEDLRGDLHDADVAGFLTKPIAPRTLMTTIEQLFADGARPRPAPALPQVEAPLRGLKLLLVEDNEINQEIALELLADAGLLVDVAENGRVACEAMEARGGDYAAILMDVQMPEMDGFTATRIIRRNWPAGRLPIVAMTAHAHEEEKQRCREAGMDDHVAKPVDPAALVATLNRWLKPRGDAALPCTANGTRGEEMLLPDSLPPFDIPAALRRVNGKTALLRRLILSFGSTYGAAPRDLRVYLSTGLLPDARRLAHSLKGVAGSLELAAVQRVAADIERAIAEGDMEQARSAIVDLEEAIAPAVAAARSLAGEPVDAGCCPPSAADPARMEAARDALRDMLLRRSLRARTGFERYAVAAAMTPAQRAAHPLHRALERLDYDAALAWIDAQAQAQAQDAGAQ